MKKLLFFLMIITIMAGSSLLISGCHYSCKSYHKLHGTGTPPPEIANTFYWSDECMDWAAAQVEPVEPPAPVIKEPEPEPEPKPEPKPVVAESQCGPYIVSRIYPCDCCGEIKLDKTMPKQVQVNAPFEYTIKLTNLTDTMIADVQVTERLSKNFKFESSSLPAKAQPGKLVWQFDEIGPKDSKLIKIIGSATSADCLKQCATVTYVVPVCGFVQVVEPKLSLIKEAPSIVTICQDIPLKFTVTNSGTGKATNVKITDMLPEGLVTSNGKKSFTFDVGTLEPDSPRRFEVKSKALKTGTFTNKAAATADAGLKVESNVTMTVVTQPVLTIEKTGPEKLYLGRPATYTITVTNTGDAAAVDTVIEETIPAGIKKVRASQGGQKAGSKVLWRIGTLQPKAARTVTVEYVPSEEGVIKNKATANAGCANAVNASAQTSVKGIPALLLEVIDITDPIEVGSNVTYMITITNQGSATATNVTVKAFLEDSMKYVSSSGKTTGTLAGNTVTFKPLPGLSPKARTSWTVVVKAVKKDDVRFKVIMNSDQLERDVEETESTNFYE